MLSLLNISLGGSLWARFNPRGALWNQCLCDLTVAQTNVLGDSNLHQSHPDDGHVRYVLPGAFCNLVG